MTALFTLDLETRDEQHATFRLGDEHGDHLDAWELALDQLVEQARASLSAPTPRG